MANLRFYWELLSKQLAYAATGPVGYQLPPLRQEDVVGLEIGFIRQITPIRSPFESVNVAGWSLRATVGTAANSLATTVAFTPDSTSYILEGELSLNTAGIAALADNAEVYFELIATYGTSIYGKRFPVKIEKGIYTSGSLVTPPGDVALGQAQADRTYVKRSGGAGEGQIWTSPDGLRQVYQYLGNDGQMHTDVIS